jgi:hypothetical protein
MHDNDTKPIMAAQWWKNKLHDTDLGWLQDTSYSLLDHGLICAFMERWHEETSSFHLPIGEMTVTLDDVACLLHLPIDGMLMSAYICCTWWGSRYSVTRAIGLWMLCT